MPRILSSLCRLLEKGRPGRGGPKLRAGSALGGVRVVLVPGTGPLHLVQRRVTPSEKGRGFPMKTEDGHELEEVARELRARNAVMEAVLTQILLRFANLYDPPQEALRIIMSKAEDSLREARKHADPEHKALATDAVTLFEEYSGRLIAAITPNTTAN